MAESKQVYIPIYEKNRYRQEIFNAFRRLDILSEIVDDETITEIMINGPDDIFVEKNGSIIKLDKRFSSREKLEDVIQQIVSKMNRRVNESSPIVDSRLEDGSRVNVVLQPVAINGPILTIRKFPKTPMTMEQLISFKSITAEAANFLRTLVEARYNIFVSGGTGSGKTSFLNALSNYIPVKERIITVEDSAELRLDAVPNLVRLESRNANIEGNLAISIRDLIKSALRMRPDRIIVGEIRGEEAVDMLNAMNTGHDGSMSTGHGNSPKDMISRIETMVLMGMDIPLLAVRTQVASSIDILVHLGRLRDGTRKVLSIDEVLDVKDGEIRLASLFEFREESQNRAGRVVGKLVRKPNKLVNDKKLQIAGKTI